MIENDNSFLVKAKKTLYNRIHRTILFFTYYSKPLIRKQLRNPLTIPIIIISFNQLYYLKKLIDFLIERNFSNIIIIDNNSTYTPLLTYFNTLDKNKSITIHQLKTNKGHLVFWKNEKLFKLYSKGFYVVTDADIVPKKDVPFDFMDKFKQLLNKYLEVTKVGFNLVLDDIPDFNPNKKQIINWEKQYWKEKRNDHYIAPIDTTFALYRPNYTYNKSDFFIGLRTEKPYAAIHGGWYINPNKLTDEQDYYIKTANSSSSWLINATGDLANSEFNTHYR